VRSDRAISPHTGEAGQVRISGDHPRVPQPPQLRHYVTKSSGGSIRTQDEEEGVRE
jgi:hypothetical protein